MSCRCDFSNGGDVFVFFSKSSVSEFAKKSFIFNIEYLYKNYINMGKVKVLQSRLRSKVKRYDFLKDYLSTELQSIDDGFIMSRDMSEIDYLDNITMAISYFIVLHSICKIPTGDYNILYEKSSTYEDFIVNYIEYVKSWSTGKTLHEETMYLIEQVELKLDILKSVLIRNINVRSVFDIYTIGTLERTSSDIFVILGIFSLVIIAILIGIFLYKKFKK